MGTVTELPQNRVLAVVLDEYLDDAEIDAYRVLFSLLRGVVAVEDARLTPEHVRGLRTQRREAMGAVLDAMRKARVFPDQRVKMVCAECFTRAGGELHGLAVKYAGERCSLHPDAQLIVPASTQGDG